MLKNIQHTTQLPVVGSSAKNIDTVVTSLLRLKGMFGAVSYLVNPDSKTTGYPAEHFENWFADIQSRLDEMVNLLGQA